MIDMMVDLETLGQTPGCVILSIGCVMFGPKGLGEEFYVVVNTDDSKKQGLFTEPSTVEWWERQSPEAREVLKQAANKKDSVPLKVALDKLSDFVRANGGGKLRIHGNGANFDEPILAVAYFKALRDAPWKFFNSRCHRTNKSKGARSLEPKREGTYHNALDDAKHQARHAIALHNAGVPIFV